MLLLFLWCCQMLSINSFCNPHGLMMMNINAQKYLQRSSTKYKNNNFDTAYCRYHMIMQLFSTKSVSTMKSVDIGGSTGSVKKNIFKTILTSNKSNNSISNSDKQQQPLLVKKTGAFVSKLPEIYPSPIHFKRAMRRTREIKIDSNIKNLRNANRYSR